MQSYGMAGCITCKIRKVKCNEKKPSCERREKTEKMRWLCVNELLEAERSTGRRASRTLGYAFLWKYERATSFLLLPGKD
jgi:Fungal Zn(2)-Cys(6) binuclear cluster domain